MCAKYAVKHINAETTNILTYDIAARGAGPDS